MAGAKRQIAPHSKPLSSGVRDAVKYSASRGLPVRTDAGIAPEDASNETARRDSDCARSAPVV